MPYIIIRGTAPFSFKQEMQKVHVKFYCPKCGKQISYLYDNCDDCYWSYYKLSDEEDSEV